MTKYLVGEIAHVGFHLGLEDDLSCPDADVDCFLARAERDALFALHVALIKLQAIS